MRDLLSALMTEIRQTLLSWDDPEPLHRSEAERYIFQEPIANSVKGFWDQYVPAMGPVVDLAAGFGNLYEMFPARAAGRYVAIEPSSVYSEMLRDRYPLVPLLRAYGEQLPLASDSISAIFAMNLLDVVENLEAILQEIERVLVRGGPLIHFLDMRPQPALLLPASSGVPIPIYSDEPERFITEFRIIADEQFEGFARNLPEPLRELALFYADQPDFLEIAETIPPLLHLIYDLSDRVRDSRRLKPIESIDIFRLLERRCRRLLGPAGLQIEYMGITGSKVVCGKPDDPWVRELDEEVGGNANYLKKVLRGAGGYFEKGHSPELEAQYGPDKILIEASMHAIVATKP